MKRSTPPKIRKFPAAKQRRMDVLLDKNSEGTITPREKLLLQRLVEEAQDLMIANSKLLAEFVAKQRSGSPPIATPVTLWVTTRPVERS